MNLHPNDPDLLDLEGELTHEQREVAGLSQGEIARKRFVRHKLAMVGLGVLVGIILLSISSIGAGPIPGWYEYKHTDLVPVQADDGPTMSVIPRLALSLAPTSSSVIRSWAGSISCRCLSTPGAGLPSTTKSRSRPSVTR